MKFPLRKPIDDMDDDDKPAKGKGHAALTSAIFMKMGKGKKKGKKGGGCGHCPMED